MRKANEKKIKDPKIILNLKKPWPFKFILIAEIT